MAEKPACIPQTHDIYLFHLSVWLMGRHYQNREIIASRLQLNLCDNSKVFALDSIAHMSCST